MVSNETTSIPALGAIFCLVSVAIISAGTPNGSILRCEDAKSFVDDLSRRQGAVNCRADLSAIF